MAFTYTFEKLDYNDKDLFENKSFTVSYDPLNENWISYHSYLPNHYLPHPTKFLKFENQIISSSDSDLYQEDMPFIIEVVFNQEPLLTKVFDNLTWEVESSYEGEFSNDFFDELIVYNEQQSSGIIVLDKDQSSPTNNVTKKEKNWNFNRLLDISINAARKKLFTNDWQDIQDDYYIDKVINPASIDLSKPWYLKGRFRDKYLVVRFKYNNKNLDMKKILCNFVSSNIRLSNR